MSNKQKAIDFSDATAAGLMQEYGQNPDAGSRFIHNSQEGMAGGKA